MNYRGSQNYDQDHFFDQYTQRRAWTESANETIEKPIIDQMLDQEAKHILDLGCGNASFGNELIERGAISYLGLEGSIRMVEAAQKTLQYHQAQVIHTTLEEWDYPEEQFDLVVSRLVIHYIQDIDLFFANVYKTLKRNGTFIFSIEHPVMTSSYGMAPPEGLKQDWTVDNYFISGEREQEWLGSKVRKFHRTIEDYFLALQKAGFVIEQLRESKPCKENFKNFDTYQRRLRIPLFLFLGSRKV